MSSSAISAGSAVHLPKRDLYDALTGETYGRTPAAILAELAPALPTPFVNFDRKGRGDALNHDLYGYCPEQRVGVVQIRHAFRRRANGYLSTHKTYVLAGYNEGGEPFRHPISGAAVRAACRRDATPAEVVRAAQRWMWGVTEAQLETATRQGDVLLVPERRLPSGEILEESEVATVGDTHEVRSLRVLRIAGKRHIYALNPRVRHTKQQHETIRAMDHDGWYSVRLADTATSWDFSQRLGD